MPIRYEKPEISDGAAMWALARDSGGLDLNSPYYYLTLANEFSDTCTVAKSDSNVVVGFICGFRPPRAPDTVFVWQIAVDRERRRRGLAQSMLQALLLRLTDQGVQYLEATVTPSNSASARMFRSLAERLGAACGESVMYEESLFPSDKHEEERLLRIGPIDAKVLRAGGNQMALPGSGLEE